MNKIERKILARPYLGLAPVVVFFFLGLDWTVLIDWDENIYAEVTRRMVASGDYLRLSANGQPFAEKPPFYFWCMSVFFRLFGATELAARLPSALSALALVLILYLAGRRLGGRLLGVLWAVVYAFSFGPLLSARMAVIDHMFNTMIAAAALALYFYDEEYGRYRAGEFGRARHWLYLLGAAVIMGVAVLTKGPLGGVIPLLAFACVKFARPLPRVNLWHFAACGTLSPGVALSWYLANYLVQGESFLAGFIGFQGSLFSKPLDGHEGPFFFHVPVALLGLFPWTPLLWLWRDPARRAALIHKYRPLVFWALGWVLFVQVLFAFVSTKLPHYSASMYIPLSFLVAIALERVINAGGTVPRAPVYVMIAFGLVLGVFFGGVPYFMEAINRDAGFVLIETITPPPGAFLTGVFLTLAGLVAAFYFWRGRVLSGVLAAAFAMGCWVLAVWGLFFPQFSRYNQGPVMAMVHRAHAAGGDLALYRHLSFAAMFYGKKDILVLHSYKFAGDPDRLKTPGERDLYVIAPRKTRPELEFLYPELRHLEDGGQLSLWMLPARVQAK